MGYLSAFLIALLASLLLTPLVIKLSLRVGLVDKPNARKVHAKVMPRAGGIAIFLAFGLGIAGTGLVGVPHGFPFLGNLNWHFVGGATCMFLLGLLDDVHDLSPRWKFLGQFSVSAWMVLAGFRIHSLGFAFLDHPYILSVVTFVWITGVTNAVNLIDGMDGLAAGISVLVMSTMAVIALASHTSAAVLVLVLPLAGATLGFLRYNFNPAKIFMGDCGSLFLGFSLAVIAVINTSVHATATGFMIAIVALGVPLFDTLFSMARRILVGRKPFSPDREHTHHKILAKGFSHRQAVLILYALTAILCGVSYAMVLSDSRLSGALLTAYPFVAYLLVRRLDWIPRIVWIQQRRQRIARERRYRHGYRTENLASRLSQGLLQSRAVHWFLELAVIAGSWGMSSWITGGWATFGPLQLSVWGMVLGCGIHYATWVVVAIYFKTHQDIWRYIEFNAIGRHIKPMMLSAMFAALFADVVFGMHLQGRFLVTLLLSSGAGMALVRLAPNFYYNFVKRQSMGMKRGPRVVVFGAGDSGESCLHLMIRHDPMQYRMLGFIDDDPLKHGKTIYGNHVLGGLEDLERIHHEAPFDAIVLSTIPRSSERRKELAHRLQMLGVRVLKFSPQFQSIRLSMLESSTPLSPGRIVAPVRPISWMDDPTFSLEDFDSAMDLDKDSDRNWDDPEMTMKRRGK